MSKWLLTTVLFICFFIYCGAPQQPGQTVPSSPGAEVAYTQLSESELQRLLKVLPTFIDIIEKEGKEVELKGKPGDIMSSMQAMGMVNKQIAGLDAKLRAQGMGWNEFWPAYVKTMLAYGALLLDSLKVETQKEMAKNQSEIAKMEAKLNDPKVSETEKQMIKTSLEAIKSFQNMFAQIDTVYAKVPQTNKLIVNKYKNELDKLLDRD